MSALLDVLSAMIVGGMVLLMIFNFQYQLTDTAQSVIYIADMMDHMQEAATRLNNLISLAGIGYLPANMVTVADSIRLEYKTKWDYRADAISGTEHRIVIQIANTPTDFGRALQVTQDGSPINDLGYIFWIDRLRFRYFDINGQLTTTPSAVRSVDMWLTFRRSAPTQRLQPLRTKIQMRCYLMNAYLAGG